MFRFLLLLLILIATFHLHAQEPPCGLKSVTEAVAPVYPPIGRVAHVFGPVVILASFDLTGKVTEVRAVSGPEILRGSALDFVKGWRANAYGGSRSCPVVVEYVINGVIGCEEVVVQTSPEVKTGRVDTQHFRVAGMTYSGCDLPAELHRRRKFGMF